MCGGAVLTWGSCVKILAQVVLKVQPMATTIDMMMV